MGRSYYDYENYKVDWKDPSGFTVIEQVGSGGFSEVYKGSKETTEGIKEGNIKILKPTNEINILREIKILDTIKGGPSMVKYLEAGKDDEEDTYGLVFEESKMVNLYNIREDLSLEDIKVVMYQLLEGINFAHSKGIMHRDIKLENILVDQVNKELQIIDWGLSEFYHPHFAYSTRVCSKFYRPLEVILPIPYYDYSIDIWGIGVMFAELILLKAGIHLRSMFVGSSLLK